MRVLSQMFLYSSCTCCPNCCHGFHSSSALKLEDAQQVSPCQCPIAEVVEDTLNGNAKDKGLHSVKLARKAEDERLDDVKEKENIIHGIPQSAQEKFGNELDVDNSNGNLEEEDRRTSFPIDILQAEAENLDECAAENGVSGDREIDKGTPRSIEVPKSILKKPSFPGTSSSLGSSSANRRVKWMPDEQLVDVQEIEDGSVHEEDETRRCVCIIL